MMFKKVLKFLFLLIFIPYLIPYLFSAQLKPKYNANGVSEDSNPLVKKELDLVRIDEKVGNIINSKLSFKDQNGNDVELSQLIVDKPVVLSFVYYECPLFCTYVLKAKEDLLKKMELEMGVDYDAITISFDYKDDLESTKTIHKKYTEKLKGGENWNFLYGKKKEINEITSQLGFYFKWIEENQEYAHTAAIYILTPEKKISRYFYGIYYNEFDVKMAVLEAKNEKYKSTTDRVLLYCYRYSSDTRGYALQARNVMKAGGLFAMVGLFGFIIIMFRKERINKKGNRGKVAKVT